MPIHSILVYLQIFRKAHPWKKAISQHWLCEEMEIWLCNQIAMCSFSRCEQIKRKPNLDLCQLFFYILAWFWGLPMILSNLLHGSNMRHGFVELLAAALLFVNRWHDAFPWLGVSLTRWLPVHLWNKPRAPP